MLASISATQLDEWAQFFELEPWGEQRADWRTAQIAAILANVHRKSGTQIFKPSDFMVDQRTPGEKQRAALHEIKRQALERGMRARAAERAKRMNGGG